MNEEETYKNYSQYSLKLLIVGRKILLKVLSPMLIKKILFIQCPNESSQNRE